MFGELNSDVKFVQDTTQMSAESEQHVLWVKMDKRVKKYPTRPFQVSNQAAYVPIKAHKTFGDHNPWWGFCDRKSGNKTII